MLQCTKSSGLSKTKKWMWVQLSVKFDRKKGSDFPGLIQTTPSCDIPSNYQWPLFLTPCLCLSLPPSSNPHKHQRWSTCRLSLIGRSPERLLYSPLDLTDHNLILRYKQNSNRNCIIVSTFPHYKPMSGTFQATARFQDSDMFQKR